VILHARAEWYRADTWQAHAWFNPAGVVGIAWHYPGAAALYCGATRAEVAGLLRAMDADYLRTRGYNLGYSFVIDRQATAEVWCVRGLTDRPASNGSPATNSAYAGVLFLTPALEAAPTPSQVWAARELVGYVRAWAPHAVTNVPHGALYPTACPGPAIAALLGDLEPPAPAPPAVPARLIPQGDDMALVRYRHPAYANVFIWPEGMPESPKLDGAASALPLVEEDHLPALTACCFKAWGSTDVADLERRGLLVRVGPPA
jgi:hypothetical protein